MLAGAYSPRGLRALRTRELETEEIAIAEFAYKSTC